jgi:single-stranded-DNA-specific exonuclease
MSPSSKRWLISPKASPEQLRQYRGMSPILAQVLHNRGFANPNAAYEFLYSKEIKSSAFEMKGMNKAVARIRQAIKNREPIIVYGDFDADGVTSTVLLVTVLQALNAVVKPYIPHRVDEGYGLNSQALRKLAASGVKLVITVDCGIRSVEDVEDGKAAGLDIIITDHHTIGPQIPNALAVLNPKQEDCKYPEDMLAGVGVAYRLAEALLTVANGNDRRKPEVISEMLLDLVATGTVADLAPLNRLENRVLVRRGLDVLNRAQRPGIQALLDVAGLKAGGINAMNIGFAIGPRINAAGRLESAMVAYDLLSSHDAQQALQWAEQLQALNTKRQELTREAQENVRIQLEEQHEMDKPLIFAAHHGFLPGIVGLVAGRLTEEFFRPTVVMELGETESRASCRSIPQFDITHALDNCADLLVRHGGHASAAGFTVLNENIPALKKRLMDIAEEALQGQELLPTIEIDAELDVHHLSDDLCMELAALEPTGYHNPAPVFVSRNVRVLECRTVGKDGQHLKMRIARAGQPPLDAIGFNLGAWASHKPDRVDLAYELEMNEWNGRQSLQLNVQDVHRVGE